MSEDGFHVHGVHEHEIEHQAHTGDAFASRIAVMTAILATVGAIFSFQGGAEQNDALIYKNDAAIRRTEASDQWNFYQAKSAKQNLAEFAATLHLTEIHADYPGDVRFPPFDRTQWREAAREEHAAADGAPAHAFVTLVRDRD